MMVVDLIGSVVKLCLAIDRQALPLERYWLNKPIGVLVAASLPRSENVAKVHGYNVVGCKLAA